MHARLTGTARRRWVATAVALAVVGGLAPAAMAQSTVRKATVHKATVHKATVRKAGVPVRTGLIVSHCEYSHRAPDDPIVHPGVSGASHSHDFFGNNTTNAHSTVDSLRGHTTTCHTAGDTAAYWTPTMLVNAKPVSPAGILAYYSVFDKVTNHQLPIGLKIVAGGPANVRFTCFRHGMPTAAFVHMPACRTTDYMAIGINFPNCWNGTDLDSPDHRSHMAYAVKGVCPSTHPVRVPRLAIWVLYRSVPKQSVITLASGGLETAHADFFNAWDPKTLAALHHFCLDGNRECYKLMPRVLKALHLKRNR